MKNINLCLFLVCAPLAQSVAQNLTFDWVQQFGGPSYESGVSIAVDKIGNSYTVGEFYGTTDFDPGPDIFTMTTEGSFDAYLTKLDGLGNLVWVVSFQGLSAVYAYSVFVDDYENVYVTGSFNSIIDFDPGIGTFNQ